MASELLPFVGEDVAGNTFRTASESWEKQANARAHTEALRQNMDEQNQTRPTRLRRMEADTGLAEEHLTQARMKPLTDVLDLIPKDPQAAKILATQGGFADKIPPHVWENADAAQGMSNAMKFGEKMYPDPAKLQEYLTKSWYPAAMDYQAKGMPLSDPRLPLMAGQQQPQLDEAGAPQVAPAPRATSPQVTLGAGQQRVDSSGKVVAQNNSSMLDDDTLNSMVEQYRAGDKSVFQNLGRGAQGAENLVRLRTALAKQLQAEGLNGRDQAAAMANFGAQSAAARTTAVREATVSSSVYEAEGTFPLAIQASRALPRSQFVPWNRLVQMVRNNTSSPEQAEFYAANQAVITAYAQAMSRTGTTSVHSQQSAEKLLSTVTDQASYERVIGQLAKEMEVAKHAPEKARQDILNRISGRPQAAAPQGVPAANPGAASASGGQLPPSLQGIQDLTRNSDGYYKAPDGRIFDPNGNPFTPGSIFGGNETIMGGDAPKYAAGGAVGFGGDDLADEMADAALRGDQSVFSYLRTAKGSKGEARVRQRIHELGKARGMSDEQLSQQDQFACGGMVGQRRGYASGGAIGPVKGAGGGRQDNVSARVPHGSYVIPADIVAAIGQGNSQAGHKVLMQKFARRRFAAGGSTGQGIQVSSGEFILSPDEVAASGGSAALDRFVNRIRRENIANLSSLPGPKHSGTSFDDGGDDGDGGENGGDGEDDGTDDGFDDTGESSHDGVDAEGNAADANQDGINDVTGDPIAEDPLEAFGQATPEEMAAANNAANTAPDPTPDPEPAMELPEVSVVAPQGVDGPGPAQSGGSGSGGHGGGGGGGAGAGSGGFGGPDLGTDFNVDAGAGGFWDTDALTQSNDPLIAPTAPSPDNPFVTPTPNNPGVPFFSLPPVTVQAPRSSPTAPPGPPSRSGGPTGGIFGPNESIIGWDPAPSPAPDLALPEITVQAPAPGLGFSARSGDGNAFDPANYGAPDALAGVSPGAAPAPDLAFNDRGGFDFGIFAPSATPETAIATAPAPAPTVYDPSQYNPIDALAPPAPGIAYAPSAPAAPAYSPAYAPAYTPAFSALTPSNMPTYGALTAADAGSVRPSMYMASGGTVGRPRPARWIRQV